MYAKMKELGPMGEGGVRRARPLDPPMVLAVESKYIENVKVQSNLFKKLIMLLLIYFRYEAKLQNPPNFNIH